jgi:hypothetical protein
MMNTLNHWHILKWLAPDMVYTPHWVFEYINGKDAYLEYIKGKIESIKKTASRVWAEIAYTDAFGSGPCVLLAQPTPDDLKATLLIDMQDDKIVRMCMCCIPSPHECRRSGEFPTE